MQNIQSKGQLIMTFEELVEQKTGVKLSENWKEKQLQHDLKQEKEDQKNYSKEP